MDRKRKQSFFSNSYIFDRSRGSKLFHFHAVFGKKIANPLWELAENSGSVTGTCTNQ